MALYDVQTGSEVCAQGPVAVQGIGLAMGE